jgi:DNA processing protein
VASATHASRDEVAAYLALTLVPGIGAARLRTLLQSFQTAPATLLAPHAALTKLKGVSVAAATAIRAAQPSRGLAVLDELDRLGAAVLLPDDPAFPPLLREIHDPPMALFVWGRAELLAQPAIAIVGSRNHSSYGGAAARLLAGGVASHVVVVSGMARGIDALAHGAALDAGGGSIGVLGNGFGVIYPASNAALYDRMIKEGCLVTELPPGERPYASTFPRRNRIISGLSRATVLIEAAFDSGAIITADCALDQGRTVLAVPGPITSRTSQGCNKLIQQGAKPALCVEDVLEELGMSVRKRAPAPEPVSLEQLTPVQRALWEALAERRHVDALVSAAGADSGTVLIALTEMEMRGLVRQEAGMLFERVT